MNQIEVIPLLREDVMKWLKWSCGTAHRSKRGGKNVPRRCITIKSKTHTEKYEVKTPEGLPVYFTFYLATYTICGKRRIVQSVQHFTYMNTADVFVFVCLRDARGKHVHDPESVWTHEEMDDLLNAVQAEANRRITEKISHLMSWAQIIDQCLRSKKGPI